MTTCVGGVVGGVVGDTCTPGTPSIEFCEDSVDTDCDGHPDSSDPDCLCPARCNDPIQAWKFHDFQSHLGPDISCGFDPQRQAGSVIASAVFDHDDDLGVVAGRCVVVIGDVDLVNGLLTNQEQRACAPIAAHVVTAVSDQTCDISPP